VKFDCFCNAPELLSGRSTDVRNQFPTFLISLLAGGSAKLVGGLAGRQVKYDRRDCVRLDQVNCCLAGVPAGISATTAFADGLRAVFFNAPVPSGCTLILVLSSDSAVTSMCIIV